ncbi:MAG: hypothetical protein AAF547_17580 [Actinomycetota bacterium]
MTHGPRTKARNTALWLASLLSFGLGSWIGWSINANLGAALWGLSAVLAFVPFLTHRDRDPDGGGSPT